MGDATKGYVLPADEISIHALVKRATKENELSVCFNVISIHALVKRATVSAHRRMRLHSISIHALVKRATANLYNDYLYFEAKYHISDIFHQ